MNKEVKMDYKKLVRKLPFVALLLTLVAGFASAGTFDNVTTVMTDTIPLFGALVNIVIAVVPMLIVVSLIGFITGLFDTVLGAVSGRMTKL
jgi:hypothetical protein